VGQLVEWPEVVTEGKDLEECRAMLRDALKEMVLAYEDLCRLGAPTWPFYGPRMGTALIFEVGQRRRVRKGAVPKT
jgi:hypothetical protein